MNSRGLMFGIAALLLCILRFLQFRAKRNGRPFFGGTSEGEMAGSATRLLLASFVTLFAELAFIRWIAVEVRIFAYFKNLALLLCFVGFGLGCALVRKQLRWENAVKAFVGILLVVRMPWWSARLMETLSQDLGGAGGIEIWNTAGSTNWLRFFGAALLATMLFLLLVWIFVPLGQIVSREMNLAPRTLSAYSLNLLGSLAGILISLLISRLMLPPWVWLGAVMAGFALLQSERGARWIVLALLAPVILMLYEPHTKDHFSLWTPYHQIDYTRVYSRTNGDFIAGIMQVNHTAYQSIVNLSDAFLARHPELMKEPPEENPYNLPFRFSKPDPTVLIVGAGAGNDAAAALRHNSSLIDAVEIDPAILRLGRNEHPEHPYDSAQVITHANDARAFLKRTARHYDLILFGLLDSHTQFSDYSNMRIDNFVYTEQSFLEAKEHLAGDGVLFVKFQLDRPWMARRLMETIEKVFGKPPLLFTAASTYSAGAGCFVVALSDRVERSLHEDASLAEFVRRNRIEPGNEAVPITTDDWPYLYQRERRIPQLYVLISILVISLAGFLYLQIPGTRQQWPSMFFCFMGAGFMLLETQVVSRLALYFGTTWQVNGIVISALLTSLLAANLIAEHYGRWLSGPFLLAALIAGLLGVYFAPFNKIPASAAMIGMITSISFAIPVFFAGLLFSREFATSRVPSADLGANILGAVAGGLLENLSLAIGMHALLIVAIVLYGLAGLGLLGRRRGSNRKPPALFKTESMHP
jgi:spermidine synthase